MNIPGTNINDPFLRFRGTGRTTRLLKEAVSMAQKGELVVIVVGHQSMIYEMQRLLREHCQDRCESTTWNSVVVRGDAESIRGKVLMVPANDVMFDWNLGWLEGTPHHTAVLYDHTAIERKFSKVLRQWLQYAE